MKHTNSKQHQLTDVAKALLAGNKGLLAMDESIPTCNKRFAKLGIPQTAEARQAYRELIVTTPQLGAYISGVILYDETIRQQASDGSSFIELLKAAGIIPGIKVDMGTSDLAGFPDEKITDGLDGLRDRLTEYEGMGLRFAKWRAVISINDGRPTEECIKANMHALARYAALCQEMGMMPIIEPEVLMAGTHTLSKCFEVTERVLKTLFYQLYQYRIDLEGMLLKPNMVLPGEHSTHQNSVEEIADATVKCFLASVPAIVPGIAFLSGGQTSELASAHLNKMNMKYKAQIPWVLTFSFSRAIQAPALELWEGKKENVAAAQQALCYRAKCNSEARKGEYVAM